MERTAYASGRAGSESTFIKSIPAWRIIIRFVVNGFWGKGRRGKKKKEYPPLESGGCVNRF